MKQALAELTPWQRPAMVLYYCAGWTLDEMGRQTGTARASVQSLIRRRLGHLARKGTFSVEDLT